MSANQPTTVRINDSIHHLMQNIVFGGTAGVIGQFSIFPLYTAKTDLHNNPDLNRGLLNRLKSIYWVGGTRGLYSGLIPTLVLTFPDKAIKLALNDYFKAHLTDSKGRISVANTMLAGAAAGIFQCSVTNPMEVLRITMQERQRQGLRSLDSTSLAKRLGFRGLYRDTPATLLRNMPFSAIFFTLHSRFMKSSARKDGTNSPSSVLVSGFLASSAASVCVTPMDLVKTRLMSETGMLVVFEKERYKRSENNSKISTKIQRTALRRITSTFAAVYTEYGIRGLYRGVDARVLINAPLFGITTMFYELQKKLKEEGYLKFAAS